jgi:hypothetical protein
VRITMNDAVSYCGLICKGCPILWATHEENETLKEKMRMEIAKRCNSLYDTKYSSKDITDCDGCRAENARLFPGCINCYIRKCARDKEIPNCAYCSEYICETLETFFKDNTESKSRLDFIRLMLDQSF